MGFVFVAGGILFMISSYEQDGGIGMVEICISSWFFVAGVWIYVVSFLKNRHLYIVLSLLI